MSFLVYVIGFFLSWNEPKAKATAKWQRMAVEIKQTCPFKTQEKHSSLATKYQAQLNPKQLPQTSDQCNKLCRTHLKEPRNQKLYGHWLQPKNKGWFQTRHIYQKARPECFRSVVWDQIKREKGVDAWRQRRNSQIQAIINLSVFLIKVKSLN